MNVIVSMLVENYNKERLRAFDEIPAACQYVERLAARLCRLGDAGRTEMFVASATVYEVMPGGSMRVFESFDGYDRGDGFCVGWDDEQ